MSKNYNDFLKSKIVKIQDSGFEINESELNSKLFDFQKHIVKKALKKGRYAIFADCGLGKTFMQLEFAFRVSKETQKPVLILAPLAVSQQTIDEGKKLGYRVEKLNSGVNSIDGIYITNYEQIENLKNNEFKNHSTVNFSGIVLDESSILKSFTGKTKNLIIDTFFKTKYKLACTATPSPNDINEIGNHSEFLNIMDAPDMRMRWFVRENEGINNYRLKGHAEKEFYAWVGSWASVLRKPSDIGYNMEGYYLPPLNMFERKIQTEKKDNGKLFNETVVNATNFNQELRFSKVERLEEVAQIVNNSNEQFIIWIKQNEEADFIKKLIPDSVEVRGSDKIELKESRLLGFAKNEFRVLITKAKIAQFGLNFQNCRNQVFASLDFSFEGLYQAIRRSYRFGQKNEVNIYLITTDTMENVIESIRKKENQFNVTMESVIKYANERSYEIKMDYNRKEHKTDRYKLINGDSCEVMKEIESDLIDFSVFSPPFSTLFTYSDSIRDLGNCESHEEFYENYKFILSELYRIIRPGRLVAIHTKDMAVYKGSDGWTGLYDFTGKMHRLTEEAGFKYHSKVAIWTDPVLERARTNTQRLLYKQVTTDSSYSGVGLPEYLTVFRKWEGDEKDWNPVNFLTKKNFPLDTWQKWASPVWMDIQRTNVLNNYKGAKNEKDEKHICPLQLDLIERAIALWSNENDTVFSPFMGIGSEGFVSMKMNRKFIGIELKESYYDLAVKNISSIEKEQTLF